MVCSSLNIASGVSGRESQECAPALTPELRLMDLRLYSCRFLGKSHGSSAAFSLKAGDDADAIFAGRNLAGDLPGCAGYEVRRGSRLIFRHEHAPVSASVVDIKSRQSIPWKRATARQHAPTLVDPTFIGPRLPVIAPAVKGV
jgi:hypothetical protein